MVAAIEQDNLGIRATQRQAAAIPAMPQPTMTNRAFPAASPLR
jgi:hypothetical protein